MEIKSIPDQDEDFLNFKIEKSIKDIIRDGI